MVNSDRTVLTVDDWWKAKTRDVERKGMGKGKQKGKGDHREAGLRFF